MTITYDLTITAPSEQEADAKATALTTLAGQFDARTLQALAAKGAAFLNDPVWGSMIRQQLGL
jgi:hypothetical protein